VPAVAHLVLVRRSTAMNVVRTKKELRAAKDRGDTEFVVEGQLAAELRKARPIIYFGVGALAILTTGIAAAPFTVGASLVAVAAATGVEIAIIIAAVAVGLGLLLAIWMGYEEVEFNAGPPPSMTLRKKRS